MSAYKNVILVGASGNLGPSILKQFLNSSLNVSVLSRPESTKTFPSNVNVIKEPYTVDGLTKAFKGQDAIISLIGGAGLGEQRVLVDAAIAAGVKRFIPSEYGSDTSDDRVRTYVPIFNGKKAVVDYLKSKPGSIEWTALITGPFADWGLASSFLGMNLKEKKALIYDSGDSKFQVSNLHFIGQALLSILQHPAETKDKYIYVASYTVSQNELLAEVEKQTGEKFAVQKVEAQPALKDGLEKLGKGDFSAIPVLIQGVNYGDMGLGDFRAKGLSNDLLALPKEVLADTVKGVLEGKLPSV